jgi:hypothetical protein
LDLLEVTIISEDKRINSVMTVLKKESLQGKISEHLNRSGSGVLFYNAVGKIKEGKAIPVTGYGGPYGCGATRRPHFLASRLTELDCITLHDR